MYIIWHLSTYYTITVCSTLTAALWGSSETLRERERVAPPNQPLTIAVINYVNYPYIFCLTLMLIMRRQERRFYNAQRTSLVTVYSDIKNHKYPLGWNWQNLFFVSYEHYFLNGLFLSFQKIRKSLTAERERLIMRRGGCSCQQPYNLISMIFWKLRKIPFKWWKPFTGSSRV